MNAFERAFFLLKMPYHGTTTGHLEEIMRHGLQPRQADPFTTPRVYYSQDPEQAAGFANIRSDLNEGEEGGDPVVIHFPQEAITEPNSNKYTHMTGEWTEHPIPADALTMLYGPPRTDNWDEWQRALDEWRDKLMEQYKRGIQHD